MITFILPILTTSLLHFVLKGWRMWFLNLGLKGLQYNASLSVHSVSCIHCVTAPRLFVLLHEPWCTWFLFTERYLGGGSGGKRTTDQRLQIGVEVKCDIARGNLIPRLFREAVDEIAWERGWTRSSLPFCPSVRALAYAASELEHQ